MLHYFTSNTHNFEATCCFLYEVNISYYFKLTQYPFRSFIRNKNQYKMGAQHKYTYAALYISHQWDPMYNGLHHLRSRNLIF